MNIAPQHIESIGTLLKIERFVLLHGQSDVGKTTFLHQTLFSTLLQQQKTLCLYLDLALGFDVVFKQVFALIEPKHLIFANANRPPLLWDFVQAFYLLKQQPLLLVFDHFECFFYENADTQQALIALFRCLVYSQIPDAIEEALMDIPRKERSPEQKAWAEAPDCKTLLVMQSEHLAQLELLFNTLPTGIFNRRYLLPAIDKKTAANELLNSSYSNDCAISLLDQITQKYGAILPFQLKILQETSVKTTQIEDVFLAHYRHFLNLIHQDNRTKVQHLLEEVLVADGTRAFLDAAILQQQYPIDASVLQQLLDGHWLRRERTAFSFGYRIAHNCLLSALSASCAARKEQEQTAALNALRAEARRERQRKSLFLVLSLLLAVATSAAIWQWRRAEYYHQVNIQDHCERFFQKGLASQFIKCNYKEAMAHYEAVLDKAEEYGYNTDTLHKIRHVYLPTCSTAYKNNQIVFEKIMSQAFYFVEKQAFDSAVVAYQEAIAMHYNTPKVRYTLDSLENPINDFLLKNPDKKQKALSSLQDIYASFIQFYDQHAALAAKIFANDSDNLQYFQELHQRVRQRWQALQGW